MSDRGFQRIKSTYNPVYFPKQKNHLLVIGINKYKSENFRNLNNAVKDAETIRDLLLNHFQFKIENTKSLFDENATREKIIDVLDIYHNKLSSEENLVIYFAGHGAKNKIGDVGYLIPSDAEKKISNYVSSSDIRDIIRGINAQHIYLIIDSCFSGSVIDRNTRPQPNVIENLPFKKSPYFW